MKSIDPATPLHYPKPMKVSAQYAQEHFADILTGIDTGEEVELTRHARTAPRPQRTIDHSLAYIYP